MALLLRLLLALVLRRRAQGRGLLPKGVLARVMRLREDLNLGLRLIGLLLLTVATGVVGTTAVAALALGPRWVGVVLALVTLPGIVITVRDAIGLRHRLEDRRRRRRDQDIRDRVGEELDAAGAGHSPS